MVANKKYISLWMPELGSGLGQNFQLSCSTGQVLPSTVKRFELIKGINVEVSSSATSITITPTDGSCQNPITVQINNNCQGGECSIQAYASCSNAGGTDAGDGNSTPSQTPTPTLTPTPIVNPAILPWEESTLPSSLYWQSVDYVNGKYFALANGTLGAYSDDAISWTQIILPNNGWRNVTFGNGRYVATGFGTTGAYSDDGVTWTASIMPSSQNWRTVTFGNGKFVTIAHESNKAAYSNDGITWIETILPRSSYWASIAYGDGKFVAISSFGNEAAYSSDGITWNRSLLPDEPIIPSGAVRVCGSGIIYANGRFLAIASQFQSASLALYSNDGVNWTQVPLVDNSGNPVTEIGYSLTYGNNGFFSTGTSISNIGVFSIDGIHWTKITLPSSKGWIYSTYGGNGRYVTIGNNSNIIAYSSPVSATPTPTPTPTPTRTPTPTLTPAPTPTTTSTEVSPWTIENTILLEGAAPEFNVGDPHFTLFRGEKVENSESPSSSIFTGFTCPPDQFPLISQWDDNGLDCRNEMLLCYIRSGSDWASVFYTNSQFDSIAPASMITQIRVKTSEGQNIYDIASFSESRQQILNLGGVTMYAQKTEPCLDIDMQFKSGAIIDELGGGIAVILKKIIAQAGFWTSGNGPEINGFSIAGSDFDITRADLENAASAEMGSPTWNKVVFPGSDFAILDSTEFAQFPCREPVLPGWDPLAIRVCPTTIENCIARGGTITYGLCECLEGPGGANPDMIQVFCNLPAECECPPTIDSFFCEGNAFFQYIPASCCPGVQAKLENEDEK
jgi:hypothetical protein